MFYPVRQQPHKVACPQTFTALRTCSRKPTLIFLRTMIFQDVWQCCHQQSDHWTSQTKNSVPPGANVGSLNTDEASFFDFEPPTNPGSLSVGIDSTLCGCWFFETKHSALNVACLRAAKERASYLCWSTSRLEILALKVCKHSTCARHEALLDDRYFKAVKSSPSDSRDMMCSVISNRKIFQHTSGWELM